MSTDLTTTRGGELPDTPELTTPEDSNSGFEVTEEEKIEKRGGIESDMEFMQQRYDSGGEEEINAMKGEIPDGQLEKAEEEGLATVSGPPVDSNMNVMDDKVHVSTASIAEKNLTDEDLTSKTLTDKVLGEMVDINENYIKDQFGQVYRPVYEGESLKDDYLIFDNKYYTTENVGNCEFCQGAGKITVERLGLKDCPDCDGTGDIQNTPMADPLGEITPDPMEGQQPTGNAPDQFGNDPSQPTGQDQIPQQPMPQDPQNLQEEKPKFGEAHIFQDESNNLTFDIPRGGKIEFKVGGESKLVIGEDNPNRDADGKFASGSGSSNNDDSYDDDDEKKYKLPKGQIRKNRTSTINTRLDNMTDASKAKYDKFMKGRKIDDLSNKEIHKLHDKVGGWEVSCGCKKKAQEANIKKYEEFIDNKLCVLKTHAKANEAVSIMYGLPTISKEGKKIKGTLAYAGVSLNDRIYLPEELAKGHGMTLPLLLNHSSTAGAENELDRLDEEMLRALENEEDYQVGEVKLTWDPKKLTLFYEGVVTNEFFQKEIDDMDMAVSLGIFYDSDSPTVCDHNCYTMIRGAEFREVSLVYHAGFPIATIEAVEAKIKEASLKAGEDHFEKLAKLQEEEQEEGELEHVKDVQDIIEDVEEETEPKDEGTEELDQMPEGQLIDAEPKEITVESFVAPTGFSVRGVTGMTVSNSNGVQKYKLDPTMSYETNMIHFDVTGEGAQIYGEEFKTQLQPKMTTPSKITKILEDKPDIKITDSDEDILDK